MRADLAACHLPAASCKYEDVDQVECLFALQENGGNIPEQAILPAMYKQWFSSTYSRISFAGRLSVGIPDDMIRDSVGIEDVDGIIRVFDQAFQIARGKER